MERCKAKSQDGYICEDTEGHKGDHWAWLKRRYWKQDFGREE